MSLVERIANNEAGLTEIKLGDSAEHYFANVTEIVDALSKNTMIDYVRIDREFLPSLLGEPEKKATVVTAIGKLPALRELRIMSGPVHANVLGLALKDAVNLENLELGSIDLKGSQEDIKHLEDSLRGHGKLTSFTLANFNVEQKDVSLDDLVKALGTISTLKTVILAAHKDDSEKSHFTGEALAALCAENQFQELKIANFRLLPTHYDLIASAVARTTTLQTLRLNRVGMAQPCLIKLAHGMKDNKTLVTLDLSSNNLEDVGVAALANALKDNTTLKHLCLWNNKTVTEDGFKALHALVEENRAMEKLDVPNRNSEYALQIDDLIKQKRAAMAA